MSGAEQANLLPRPGVQVPGGLARSLVLALLLASAIMPSGKGGAAAGRAREDGAGPGAERQDGPPRERAIPSVRSRWRYLLGQGLYSPGEAVGRGL